MWATAPMDRQRAASAIRGATSIRTRVRIPIQGILVVDVADPANPSVVGEIGSPYAGQIGITTRELRVWPQEHLLMVMTFRCSSVIHACPPGTDTTFPFDIKFFDLSDPVHPSSYVPTSQAGQLV
jgi:hypothetical protein